MTDMTLTTIITPRRRRPRRQPGPAGLLPRSEGGSLPSHMDAMPVTVATVAMADVADTFEAGGVVQARTTATLMARILAPIREVHAAPGDHVRAGRC